jgi:hypothetical protein
MLNKKLPRRTLLAMLLLTSGLAACTTSAPPSDSRAPEYDIVTPGAGDTVTISTKEDGTFIDVRSDRGIGKATVTLAAGQWPEGLTLRFYLAGLESLQLDYEDTKVALSVTTSSQILESANSADSGEIATDPNSPYWMAVTFVDADGQATATTTRDGAILVTMPPDFFAINPRSFGLNWIDFYR